MIELICITCPKGCHLKVDENNDYEVTGNNCPRGAVYGKKECTHPTRVITSTVKVKGASQARVSVKTSQDVPKELMFDIMTRMNSFELQAPVKRGQVVEANICGSGADLVVTKDLEAIA